MLPHLTGIIFRMDCIRGGHKVKNEPDEVSVGFELVGDAQFKICYHSPLLKDHFLDYPSIPQEERPGQMRRLLCAAVVGCFSGTVYSALVSRGARIKSLKGTGTTSTEKSNGSPPVVKSIDILVEVDVDDEDLGILEKVRKIAEKGCLISQSIAPSIAVTHTVVRTCVGVSDTYWNHVG
jgi:uncharacterized OsmC-like protein